MEFLTHNPFMPGKIPVDKQPLYWNDCRIRSMSEDSGIDQKKEERGEQQHHQHRIFLRATRNLSSR